MAGRLHDLGGSAYALTDGANIGIAVSGKRALIIDAGLDRDAAKKALRAVAELGAAPSALVLTHGHADHFGGAAWIAGHASTPVYAPALEGVFAQHPLLEPLFLYGGAEPIAELRGKFTYARDSLASYHALSPGEIIVEGVPITSVALPGHAPQQVGVAYGNVLYCGDAVFPAETLKRHPIPFCANMDAWIDTLTRLTQLNYAWFVPGHGHPTQDIAPLATATLARLREIRSLIWEALAQPSTPQALLQAVAAYYSVTFQQPQFWLLALTTIHAALTSLQQSGEAAVAIQDNMLLWQRVG